jgi:hypothetical protein
VTNGSSLAFAEMFFPFSFDDLERVERVRGVVHHVFVVVIVVGVLKIFKMFLFIFKVDTRSKSLLLKMLLFINCLSSFKFVFKNL